MQRRNFIKQSCLACGGLLLGGSILTMLEGCQSLPTYKATKGKEISVPASQFTQSKVVVVSVPWMSFDILLVKKTEETYKALYMKCSHQDQILSATESGLFCVAHGSSFDLDGNVKKEPAIEPLQQFKTRVENNQIIITL